MGATSDSFTTSGRRLPEAGEPRQAAKSRPRPLEKHEQQRIVQYARLRGAVVYVLGTRRRRSDYPGTNQTPGLPDLWLMWPPRHGAGLGLWWEVKRQGGRRTPEQVAFGDLCQQTHTAYGYGTFDDFRAWLDGYAVVKPL